METKERVKRLTDYGITIKAIASISKINCGTLYRYTSNKANLSNSKQSQLERTLDLLERLFLKNDSNTKTEYE